jgi:uncharacterized RDD family membrane protein YckC
MASRAYCASCGREVWLGRNGGCQFGHPVSDLSNAREARPGSNAAPVAGVTAAASTAAVAAPPALDAGGFAAGVPSATDRDPLTSPEDDFFLGRDLSWMDTDCVGRRVVARLLDQVTVVLLILPLDLGLLAVVGDSGAFQLMANLIGFGVIAGYFVVAEALTGRTLWKKVLGLEVRTEEGKRPSILQTLLRQVLMMVDSMFFAMVGIITMSKTGKNQRIGDLLAKTVVVRTG